MTSVLTDPIAMSRAYMAQIETLRLVNILADQTWVVMSGHGIPTIFDFTQLPDGRRQATGARSCSLMDAPCFTRKDAETLAELCIDGTGKRSVAMFINDAIDMHLKQQQEAIDYMLAQQAPAKPKRSARRVQ